MIGAKPGEKLYEELLTADEARRSQIVQNLFVTPPAFRGLYHKQSYEYPAAVPAQAKPYTSHEATCLSLEELRGFMTGKQVLEPYLPAQSTCM